MKALVIGNSDGIGLALTRRLLAAGHHVVGISRRASPLRDERYRHVTCDVTSAEYLPQLREVTTDGLALCVYCAGVGEAFALEKIQDDASVMRVNLLGLVETAGVVLPAMVKAGAGQLVGLSSIADESLSREAPSYAASKAGMSSYLAGLALAMRPHGVRVSNVRLGFVNTKMAKSPVRPLMIEVEQAVDVVMRVIASRRARITHPWRMDWVVRALRWITLARLALRG
jgi:short-subunit dehydrogenase